MKLVVQALSFGCELAALFFLARWGWRLDVALWLRLSAAGLAVLLAAGAWAVWAAPRSVSRLPDPARLGFEVLFYGVSVGALLVQGQNLAASAFGDVVVLQWAAAFALHLRELRVPGN